MRGLPERTATSAILTDHERFIIRGSSLIMAIDRFIKDTTVTAKVRAEREQRFPELDDKVRTKAQSFLNLLTVASESRFLRDCKAEITTNVRFDQPNAHIDIIRC